MSRKALLVNAIQNALSLRDYAVNAHGDTKHTKAWCDYGYPEALTFEHHYQMYKRFGIAKAGIEMTIDQCWSEPPTVHQASDKVEAENRSDRNDWEREFDALAKKHRLWQMLRAADIRQSIYQYGGLVVQVRGTGDQIDWKKPLDKISADNIVKLIPVFQSQLKPSDYDNNRNSERYGLPKSYLLDESRLSDNREEEHRTSSVEIHHSRVIVFAEGADDGSIYGVPANEAGFNALITLEKIIGAGGEGFWKNAAMKMAFNTDLDLPDAEELDDIDEAIADFVQGLDNHLITGSLKPTVLQASLASPKEHFAAALGEYSASVKTPAKKLIGTQTGVLAADEDTAQWGAYCMSRAKNWCGEGMVRQFINWLIAHGVLPRREFVIEWKDLLAPSDDDKVSIIQKMADINQKSLGGAEGLPVFTNAEMRAIMGFDPLSDSDFEVVGDEDDENIAEGDDDANQPPN